MLSKTEWAYLAGLIDGDGSVGLMKIVRSKFAYCPYIIIGITDVDSRLHDLFLKAGLTFKKILRENHPTWKPVYRYYREGLLISPILCALVPFLNIKRKKTELLIQLIESRLPKKNIYPHPPWTIEEQALANEIQKMHTTRRTPWNVRKIIT